MTIVGYTFQADQYCPDHIAEAVRPTIDFELGYPVDADGGEYPWDTEWLLDQWAIALEIDRYDEHTFDTDDFPKVIFAGQVEDDEYCGNADCEETL
jgi:hypothetical protein